MAGHAAETKRDLTSSVAEGQGLYYTVSGIWPLISLRTFTLVTGPKVDLWLVKTVGAILAIIGLSLTLAGRQRRVNPAIQLLGAGSAAVLTTVDAVYVLRGRINRIYLLDALIEVAIIVAWVAARLRT